MNADRRGALDTGDHVYSRRIEARLRELRADPQARVWGGLRREAELDVRSSDALTRGGHRTARVVQLLVEALRVVVADETESVQ